jgi:predicted flap endonuclease-1-like 5' DNA nuclease
MEDLVLGIVFALGLLAGGFITLVVDGYFWGKHVKSIVDENRRIQIRLRDITSQLTASATQVHNLSSEVHGLTMKNEKLTAENQTHQLDLATAVAEKRVFQTQYKLLSEKFDQLQKEHMVSNRRLAVAAVEIKRLRQQTAVASKDETPPTPELSTEELVRPPSLDFLFPDVESESAAESDSAAELANSESANSELGNIEDIRGIGPTYAQRLRAGGVTSLTDLASLSAEQVADITGMKPTQFKKTQAWIDEAKELVTPFENND